MKSFNLSSKIRDLEHEPYQDHLLLDDVKEFIRKLKLLGDNKEKFYDMHDKNIT